METETMLLEAKNWETGSEKIGDGNCFDRVPRRHIEMYIIESTINRLWRETEMISLKSNLLEGKFESRKDLLVSFRQEAVLFDES